MKEEEKFGVKKFTPISPLLQVFIDTKCFGVTSFRIATVVALVFSVAYTLPSMMLLLFQ